MVVFVSFAEIPGTTSEVLPRGRPRCDGLVTDLATKRRSCYHNCAVFIFREARRTHHRCDGLFLARGCAWESPKSLSHRRVIKAMIVIPPLVRSEAVIGRR